MKKNSTKTNHEKKKNIPAKNTNKFSPNIGEVMP